MSLKDKLVGSWRPQRWEWSSCKTGKLLYATENLEGVLIYAADGMMAVQVRSTRGTKPSLPVSLRPQGFMLTMKKRMVSTPGFQWGYSGRYEIDEAQSQVLHHADVRTLWIARGPILKREFSLHGDLLCLQYTERGSHDRLTWRRV